ncbi:RNase P modulator RnpM [Microaceticoccus formicicus]|uniref:RNase P modulator RnpM n=1 Tax=Microaceticoccus formicicus TaxID=3118105 RepID=UPI003CD02552|nr:YlxR family protein [Peptoniphilaceae bacterium AMB_02]
MTGKTKKVPIRKCVGCQDSGSKKELIRIVKNKELGVVVDKTGKLNGRGAYLCKNIECLELAIKKRKLNHALKSEISNEVYKEIRDYVESED